MPRGSVAVEATIAPPVMAVERPAAGPASLGATLHRLCAATGSSPLALTRDFANLAVGKGRVAFSDYVRLRLFDRAFWTEENRRTVVGQRRTCELLIQLNYRHEWFAVVSDKIASAEYLAVHGLPTLATRAIYGSHLPRAGRTLLKNRAALRGYLAGDCTYPLFGKPVDGMQSLGSIAIRRYVADQDCAELTNGSLIPLDTLLDDIERNYGAGYIFQDLVRPHDDLVRLAGQGVGTVRFLTLLSEDGPIVFRSCWKVPVGGNHADNYWRSGNALAKLDPVTGRVERVVSGAGFDLSCLTHHPDTGAGLVGACIPDWDAMNAMVLGAAGLMRTVPMIGWDVAATAGGPVIVEMNATPDHMLPQLAESRGTLDNEFWRIFEHHRGRAKAFLEVAKRRSATL